MSTFKKAKLHKAILSSIATGSLIGSVPALAQENNFRLEEVIVSATKRSESTQDIPVAVQALGGEKLEQLGVSNFSDYLIQLPGVTAGGSGPGQNTIYIRGVASTTPVLTVSGAAGLAPNVALYLDEQPLSQPGRNLDVYAADLSRVEVLSGPQGTLFGASSQAGTVRLITNKPETGETYGSVKLGLASTSGGEASNNIEVMLNLAVSDSIALRGVVYRDDQGGYIDNVAGTLDVSEAARFRTAGTVRANGVPVSAARGGFQAGADLSGVTLLQANNADLVEDNINDTLYEGGRISASIDINENWNILLGLATQDLETDGVFFADPELGDLEIQRYADDRMEDTFDNASWTLTGALGSLEAVYTGAFTTRETEQLVDYADYTFVSQYLPYYICDYYVSYPGAGAPTGTCQAPYLTAEISNKLEVSTHELRFSTDSGAPIRATFGAFFSKTEVKEFTNYIYPGSTLVDGGLGFVDNFAFDSGYVSDTSAFPAGNIFRNDVRRTDDQQAIFGEITFDLGDMFSVVLGGRYYEIEGDLEGSSNGSFCNRGLFFTEDLNAFGTDISDLYDGDGEYTNRTCTADQITYTLDTIDEDTPQAVIAALNAPDKAEADGTIFKVTGNWTPNDDMLYYVTVSEGFRPGLLNRPGGRTATIEGATYTVPYALETDDVVNYEFGWKTDMLDGSLRFNGSIFHVEIENLQTTIFDPNIVNIFFSDNAANAEVTGIEGDFIWLPRIEGLTISGAFSFLDTEITEVLTPTDDVRKGDSLAFAPEMQINLQARYEWPVFGGDLTAHVMPYISYSDESYSDIIRINRVKMDSYTMGGLTAGVTADTWSAELYAENITDERAETSANFSYDRVRTTYAKPRTVGVRLSYKF